MDRVVAILVCRAALTLACFAAPATLHHAGAAADELPPIVHEFFVYPAGDVSDPPPGLPPLPAPGASDPALDIPDPAARYGPAGPELPEGSWESGDRNGPGSATEPAMLDNDTGPEGQLRYVEVFDPSVAPWKRGVARDRVVRDALSAGLVVGDPELRLSMVDATVRPAEDLFVGRLEINLRAGFPTPIPSVAPDMRIRSVRTEPPVAVQFARDGADNHFVIADWDGPVVMTFEVAAPAFYFDGAAPIDSRPVRTDGLGDDERAVIDAIGVFDGMARSSALDLLLEWFGGFEAGELPATDAELYRTISLARRGVCRHRAIAFSVTANALGIATRYVHNEAHAFVEVFHEGAGWRRYDLGGEAEGLDIVGDEGTQRHRASDGEDHPYPDQGAVSQSPEAAQRPEERTGSNEDGALDPENLDAQARSVDTSSDVRGARGIRTFGELPQPDDSAVRPAGAVVRLGTTVELTELSASVFAGGELMVRGMLRDADSRGLSDAGLEVWLGPADTARLDAPVVKLGELTTLPDGRFEGSIRMPAETPVGDWGIFVVFPGDVALEPSRSR